MSGVDRAGDQDELLRGEVDQLGPSCQRVGGGEAAEGMGDQAAKSAAVFYVCLMAAAKASAKANTVLSLPWL